MPGAERSGATTNSEGTAAVMTKLTQEIVEAANIARLILASSADLPSRQEAEKTLIDFLNVCREQLGQQAAAPGVEQDQVERVKAAIAEKFAPAIDMRAPYAKVMLEAAAREVVAALAVAPPAESDPYAAAKVLAEFIGYSWEGLTPDARPQGYPMWGYNGIGQKNYQGGKNGLREIAAAIALAVAPLPVGSDLQTENAQLRLAISWALGESPEGIPEFMPPAGNRAPYWWRKQLRALSTPPVQGGK